MHPAVTLSGSASYRRGPPVTVALRLPLRDFPGGSTESIPNPVLLTLWKPTLRPAAVGSRDAALFSAYLLEAPGSGRRSRTVIRCAA